MTRERWGSPSTAADREHIHSFEWTPELFDQYADRGEIHLAKVLDLSGLERVGAGRCEECDAETRRRYRLGHFELCRRCATRRRRAAATLRAPVPATEPEKPNGHIDRCVPGSDFLDDLHDALRPDDPGGKGPATEEEELF
jgi:hypothetical protein